MKLPKLKPYWVVGLVISCLPGILLAVAKPRWQKTDAQFQVTELQVEELKFKDTLIGLLIKSDNLSVSELLEQDQKTILAFSIRYTAPMQLKEQSKPEKKIITQHGLFRALHPQLQDLFKNFTRPSPITAFFKRSVLI